MRFFYYLLLVFLIASCKVEEPIAEDLSSSDQVMTKLNDIWALESIEGKPIKITKNQKIPTIEIFVGEKRFGGNDGCNNVFGKIEKLNETNIVFSGVSTTLMLCEDMVISSAYNAALLKTKKYQRKGMKLFFLDENDSELLGFKKVD